MVDSLTAGNDRRDVRVSGCTALCQQFVVGYDQRRAGGQHGIDKQEGLPFEPGRVDGVETQLHLLFSPIIGAS